MPIPPNDRDSNNKNRSQLIFFLLFKSDDGGLFRTSLCGRFWIVGNSRRVFDQTGTKNRRFDSWSVGKYLYFLTAESFSVRQIVPIRTKCRRDRFFAGIYGF
jgi:hypothetical protein